MSHPFVSFKTKVFIGILAFFAFIGTVRVATAFASTTSNFPGSVEGQDTRFDITDSSYLNISLTSSETINAYVESIPNTITVGFSASEPAASTDISISGLSPFTTYYKYQDDYSALQALTTDGNGILDYIQDLSEPHIVFIQTARSTRFINNNAQGGDCSSIGIWNQATLTCTLGQDVNETIQINSNNITLDGAGHTVNGSYTGNGIYVNASGDTIKNLTVQHFTSGIAAFSASFSISNTRVENVTAVANTIGFNIRSAINTVVTKNNFTNNSNYGIYIGWYYAGQPSRNTQVYNNNFQRDYSYIISDISVDSSSSTGTIFSFDPPIGGNYFDHYDTVAEGCVDANSDGMCDSGWNVGTGHYDNHPWTSRNGWIPPTLSAVQQYHGSESDVIAEGGTFVGNEVSISSQVSDSLGRNVKLEVELRPSSEQFDDSDALHIYASNVVASGNEASLTISDLIPKDDWYATGGDTKEFHWRYRARSEGGFASGWVDFGEAGNTDFVAQISLPMKAAGLAVELVHYPYLWGGKGWDYDQNKFVPVQTVQTGYKFYNPDIKSTDFGAGVDCSGLVMWSYDRSYDPNLSLTKNVISYEGAGGQYSYNSQTVSESDLAPGDLMFFDFPSNKTIDHVAMYVGPMSDGNDVVEAASKNLGIISSKKSELEIEPGFLATNGFHRVVQSSLASSGIQISLGSPGYLSVTDPDGNTITKDSVIPSDEEYIREIPGELYYSEMEKGTDGYPITRVYSPTLKQGNYVINVIPREGVSPSETYSLDVKSGTETVNLAQHVPIGEIPSGGYKVAVSDGGEITPVPSSLFCPLLAQSATYSSLTPASTCTFTNGPKTLQLKDSTCHPIAGARVNVRKANGSYLTYVLTNANGVADLSGYTNPDASYFEVDYHGATYSTSTGTFSTGIGVQTHPYELSLKGSDCNPITGARVNLRKADGSYVTYATTNAAGKASFEVVPNASMKLEADYHGGTWMSDPRSPDTNVTIGTDKFSLVLADSFGGAISGARVNLRKNDNTYVTYITTNDSGMASFEVLPNVPMVLEVDYHGATYQTASSTTHAQEKITTVPFGVRLLDSTGTPIAGARVNLRKADSSYVTYGLTNANGTASFEVVPGAQMKLEVDYHGATYSTNALNAATNPLTAIQTKSFGLILLANTGEPIVGARVNLRKVDGSYVTYVTTNAEGKASFEAVPHSQMRLEVDFQGATYLTGTLDVDATPLTSILAYALLLELRDSAGSVIPNARVNLRKADNSYVAYALTNSEGIASFQVVPGAIMILEANHNGGTYETAATAVSVNTTLHVQTSPITVHLTAQGLPLANTRVDLLNGSGAYVTYATTNAAGGLAFEVLPGVSHKVRATYNGTTWVSDTVTGGTEVTKDF